MQSDCPGLIHSWSFLKLFNHLQQFFQVIEAVYRLPKCTIPRHKQNLLLLRRLIHLLGKVVADLSGTAVTGIQESSDAKCSKQFIYRSATVRNLLTSAMLRLSNSQTSCLQSKCSDGSDLSILSKLCDTVPGIQTFLTSFRAASIGEILLVHARKVDQQQVHLGKHWQSSGG